MVHSRHWFWAYQQGRADDENSTQKSINQFAETEFFSIFICNSNPYFCQFRRFYNWTNDSDAQNHFRNSDYDKSTMWPLPSCFIGKYYKNRSFTLRISQFELIILVTAMLRTVNWWQFQAVGDFPNVMDRSPTYQTCRLNTQSPTCVTNIDVTNNFRLLLHQYVCCRLYPLAVSLF